MNKLPIFQKGQSGDMNFRDKENFSRWFFFGYLTVIFLIFAILIIRLFQLTIVKGEYFRRLSEQNRIRELIIEPKRGKILDRKGFVVVENRVADIGETQERLRSKRVYRTPEAIAPLIGYRQIADADNIKNDNCLVKIKSGDKVGKKGIEKIFDCQLRGRDGKKLIEVDAKGKPLRTLSVIPPQDGQTLQLAFDWDLQQKAYQLIKNQPAAVVGLNPKTGEVLLLVSSPSFNLQAFEEATSEVSQFLADEQKPLFNRATEGVYPPGSIFKLIITSAGLEEKAIDEKTQIEDIGTIQAGPLTFGNWYFLQYGKTEGMVDIVKAIRRSNDIFFYRTGEKLGPEKIKKWAEVFGYGKKTNGGLEENEGLIPSVFWKEDKLGEKWYLGDTYNLSIGQGYILVTPLQVTQATAAVANGGYLCQPQLLKIQNPPRVTRGKIQNCKKLPLSEKTLSLIQEGMKQACSSGGTGWPLFDFKIQTACKTGTAESQAKSKIPHAWFTVFAPFDNPEIALTVLVEEGGQGSDIAGPIAKEILKAYFERSE